jgi:hypothetical protein
MSVDERIRLLSAEEVQRYIWENEDMDEVAWLLKQEMPFGLPASWIAEQIKGRRKAKDKLPLWYGTRGIVYPSSLHLEQCSSEVTAAFKIKQLAPFFSPFSGGVCADLTCGFGVDTYYLHRLFNKIHAVERDQDLLHIARHNHALLGAGNIAHHSTTAEGFLSGCAQHFDVVYADPSRRNVHQKKVVRLEQGQPNALQLQQLLAGRYSLLLLKASPLLDMQQALRQLQYVAEINVVAVANQCRELLFLCIPGFSDAPNIRAVNIEKGYPQEFVFHLNEEKSAHVEYGPPRTYIYDPNRAIRKAGAFKLIANRFGMYKLHPNTHIYTADHLIPSFPGRIFEVVDDMPADKIRSGAALPEKAGHVLLYNYPGDETTLRKRLRLAEGGCHYLIACTSVQKKHLLITRRVQANRSKER